MPISPEEREQLAGELKRFATSMNLSDDQKQKLQGFLAEGREKLEAYRQQNPSASREDLINKFSENRAAIRERLTNFLSPEQLQTWDTEVAKARDAIGRRAASA
jgi:DNA-binding MurR/RpiR family transcriptional regulator